MCTAPERDAELSLTATTDLPNANGETQPLLQNAKLQLPVVATQRNPHSTTSSELYGLFLMALSTFGFSGMSLLNHIAETQYHISAAACVFLRGLVQCMLAVVYIARYLDPKATIASITNHQKKWLLCRGLFGCLSLYTFVKALELLPLGIVISLFFISPVLGIIISHLVLGEPITKVDCVAAVVSFVGVVFIAQPTSGLQGLDASQTSYIVGTACALFSALAGAIAYCILRSLGSDIHFIASVVVFGAFSSVLGVLLGGAMGPGAVMANKEGVLIMLISSTFAFGGQCLLTQGLQYCKVGPGMLIRNLDVPVGYLLGLIFLGETVSMLSLFGSTLVMSSAVIIGVHQATRSD